MLKTETLSQTVQIGNLELESGTVLKDVVLAYERVGPEQADTILVCHALTGNQHAVGTEENPGWWAGLIGPGRYIDTNRFQVITFNVLGGCNGSTGPLTEDPDTGELYRSRFPFITVRDMVRAQYLGLKVLGISHLRAVIGGSLGGMQVLEWGLLYPDYMDLLIPMAVTPFLSDYAIAFNTLGRLAILQDPAWNRGDYSPDRPPAGGLSLARIAGLLTYRSSHLFNQRFRRELKEGWGRSHDEVTFQVESYLLYQGKKLTNRFDANSYLYLLKAMDSHDIGRNRNGWKEAVKGYKAEIFCIAYSGDLLYPPAHIREFVDELKRQGKKARFHEVDTLFGHDGFLTEFDKWGQIVEEAVSNH